MREQNSVSMEVAEIEETKADVNFGDVAHLVAGARGRKVYENGDAEAGIWTVGQVIGSITDIPTCEELARRIEKDAEGILTLGSQLVVSQARL